VTEAQPSAERTEAVHALESSFAELMAAFRHYVAEAAERTSPGMQPGVFKVLSAAARLGPSTLSAIAERLHADKGLVSRGITELEGLGLIVRTPDPGDRRSRLIEVTDLGQERLDAARAPHQSRLFTTLEGWSLADIRRLATLLHALAIGEAPLDDEMREILDTVTPA
jgi:DNA-binding MarR family transcriptional regulator